MACREITSLKQENLGTLSTSTLYVPANASLLFNGAIGDFECAYNRYVTGTGLFTDELSTAIAQSADFDYDARRLRTDAPYGTFNCASPVPSTSQIPGIYTPLSTARATTDTAAARLEGWTDAEVPNRAKLLGQAYAYAGYSLVLLGESMCSAAINLGPELTPAQVFAEAKARFDNAIAAATKAADATTLNLARLGRARAELDLGGAANLAAASADAATIPASFVVNTSPDAVKARRQNSVFFGISQNPWFTVDTSFRNVLVPGGTTQDPRVVVTNLGRNGSAGAGGTPLFLPAKDATVTTPIRLASYAEAQLIIAENAAATGDLAGAAAAVNRARATHPGLPVYVVPAGATAADVKTQIIEERRREFFVEGHRLGDLRRYSLPFLPAAGAPYSTGGGNYGAQTCLPLPDVERINNPNIAKASGS
ncbi:MAG: RagB/SusD family nutrient uptake outer membrane protein [Gemmatimonadaceae bacterium]